MLASISFEGFSQSDSIEVTELKAEGYEPKEEVFSYVEQMPEFPGGQDSLMKFLKANIRYPEEARKKGIEGKVLVAFIIEADGSVSNVRAANTGTANTSLVNEALRVIRTLPRFKPGKQNGKAVRTMYQLPVVFKLD